MSIIRYFKRVQFIDALIRKKSTGSQANFARKTNMSISMLKEYLKEMKELGFPISFCKKRQTYYYEENGKMVDTLFTKEQEQAETNQYKGGCIRHFPYHQYLEYATTGYPEIDK